MLYRRLAARVLHKGFDRSSAAEAGGAAPRAAAQPQRLKLAAVSSDGEE